MKLARFSIRARLFLLLAVVAVPYAVFQTHAAMTGYRAAVTQAEDRVLGVAATTAAALEQFLAVAERSTRSLAARRGLELLGPGCRDVIHPLADAFPFFANVIVVDATGTVVCSARDTSDRGAVSAAGRRWFRTVRDEGRFGVGEPVIGPITGEWVVAMGYPIRGQDGRFAGAVAGTVELLRLESLLEGRSPRANELVTITTAEGVVVARSVDGTEWVGRALPSGTVEVERRGLREFITRTADASGLERIWGRVDLPDVGWRVYTGVPADRVSAPTLAIIRRETLVGIVTLVGVLLLAGLLFRGISRSLENLVQGIRGAGPTDTSIPLPPESSPEVAQVVTQFNRVLREREEARAAEQTARSRAQHIFENAVFGIGLVTRDGRILDANGALVSMLGYDSKEELAEAGFDALFRKGSERGPPDLWGGSGRVEDVEVEWVTRDGRALVARLNGKVVRTLDGERAAELIVEDITEQRALEDLARHQQKMEAVGRLAGGVAHEFNNLLTVLGVNSEMIRETLGPEHPLIAEAREVDSALERAKGLTRKLLAFSRREVTQPNLLDLNQAVRGLEGMLRRVLGDAFELRTDLASSPGRVWIDPGHLEQVVLNLVLNARDALGHQGGTIRLTTATRAAAFPIDEESAVPGPARWYSGLEVADDGPGIPADIRGLVFEPFFTTKPPGVGTGLGLPTVYGIVAEAGGRVELESEEGEGASFGVWLPVAAEELEDPGYAESSRGDETVLVVSESAALRDLVREMLEPAGYRVVEAGSAVAGLDAFWRQSSPLDLVITEAGLPRVSAEHLVVTLRREQPSLPVIFLTDRALQGIPGGRRRTEIVLMPFTRPSFTVAVRRVLDIAQPPREPARAP